MSKEEIFDWLVENGYKEKLIEIVEKQLFIALLSDFCQYVYESLKCSEKGKLATALTLLRKPFKENLLYFEWLLSSPDEFFEKFLDHDPESYDPSKLSKGARMNFIKKSILLTSCPSIFDGDFLYNIRYSKKEEYSLETLWNKAIHLVTTTPTYRTERQNLNFIFSNFDNKLSQWNILYNILPFLMFYTLEVVEALLVSIINIEEYIREYNRFLRQIKFMVVKGEIEKELKQYLEEFPIFCGKCQKVTVFGSNNLEFLKGNPEIMCRNCGHYINIARYFFTLPK